MNIPDQGEKDLATLGDALDLGEDEAQVTNVAELTVDQLISRWGELSPEQLPDYYRVLTANLLLDDPDSLIDDHESQYRNALRAYGVDEKIASLPLIFKDRKARQVLHHYGLYDQPGSILYGEDRVDYTREQSKTTPLVQIKGSTIWMYSRVQNDGTELDGDDFDIEAIIKGDTAYPRSGTGFEFKLHEEAMQRITFVAAMLERDFTSETIEERTYVLAMTTLLSQIGNTEQLMEVLQLAASCNSEIFDDRLSNRKNGARWHEIHDAERHIAEKSRSTTRFSFWGMRCPDVKQLLKERTEGLREQKQEADAVRSENLSVLTRLGRYIRNLL